MKINILIIVFLFLGTSYLISQEQNEVSLKFAVIADIHAQDTPDGKARLDTFVNSAIKENVDFIINLGDFCRLDSVGLSIKSIWDNFPGDKYIVMGNHDTDKHSVKEYIQHMGMPGRYYSFDKGEFHFIVLDGNNIFDGKNYTHYEFGNYFQNPGKESYIDEEQQEWLKVDLASTNKRCILFSHQSLNMILRNGPAIQMILEKENERAGFKKIVVVFGGHEHNNYEEVINGITYIQLNSASYKWEGTDTQTEKRFPEKVNEQFPLMKYSFPYTKTLFAIVSLNDEKMILKGQDGDYLSPTPVDLKLDNRHYIPYIRNSVVFFYR